MHAWAEVEHDLVYKPFISGLSKQELAILDQINGLVLAGECAWKTSKRSLAQGRRDAAASSPAIMNFAAYLRLGQRAFR